MEIVLFITVMLESAWIVYNYVKKNDPIDEVEEQEKNRRNNIEKSWQKLFNYNETIAVRDYDDE